MKLLIAICFLTFPLLAGAHPGHLPEDPSTSACKEALQWCGDNFEDDYEKYGFCVRDAALETGGFVDGFGMACPEDSNYCEVAVESCSEMAATGAYDSLNECLDYRAGGDCK